MLAVTAALMLSLRQTSWPIRLLAFPALLTTSILLLQAQAQTCVALAARGERDLDHGRESVSSAAELGAIKAQARRVAARSVAVAILVTAVYVLTG